MKYVAPRPFADPPLPRASCWRSPTRSINGPFLFKEGGTPEEYGAALDYAIAKGWLWQHESGTYVKFIQAGAELFA
jgi:hypothetical protein